MGFSVGLPVGLPVDCLWVSGIADLMGQWDCLWVRGEIFSGIAAAGLQGSDLIAIHHSGKNGLRHEKPNRYSAE